MKQRLPYVLLTIIPTRSVCFLHGAIAEKALNPILGTISYEIKQTTGNEDQIHDGGWAQEILLN